MWPSYIAKTFELKILHFENDLKSSNALDEVEVLKANTSDQMFNIMQNNIFKYFVQYRQT